MDTHTFHSLTISGAGHAGTESSNNKTGQVKPGRGGRRVIYETGTQGAGEPSPQAIDHPATHSQVLTNSNSRSTNDAAQ